MVVAAAEVATAAAADAATKPDRLATKHAVGAGARHEGALRPTSLPRQRSRSSKPHGDDPATEGFCTNRLHTTMATKNVVPVAVTTGDTIEALRQWASGRCLSADRADVSSRAQELVSGRVRRVVREPVVN